MRLFRHYGNLPPEAHGAVVAIGNFDGIHRGHRAIIAKAGRIAHEFAAPLALLTFEPHPRRFFDPKQPPFRLTPFRIKVRLIRALGVDLLFVLRFDRRLASLAPEDFIRLVLADGLAARHVVVGDNFRFGRKRLGDVTLLESEGRLSGFGVTTMARVTGPGSEPYSSSLVRAYLANGNPTRAALLLGRYWEIEGRVQRGAQRGRNLGFPTANLALGEILRPAFGVYAVRVAIEEAARPQWLPGVANLGISPMFDYPEPLLEVHLLDYEGDLYGRHLRVALIDFLRGELKLPSLAELKMQMAEDVARARATLAWESWEAEWPSSPFIRPGDEDF